MAVINAREFQEHATRILERVREEKAIYIVMDQGRPIALLLPIDPGQMEEVIMEAGKRVMAGGWLAYEHLAEEIRQAWPPDRSAQEVLNEVRK